MKKFLILLLIPIFIFCLTLIQDTYASGDKVRGDEGEGTVTQTMNEDPNCWDEPWCTPEQ